MYMENPDKKIKWNVYSFDEGIASRVPYEAAARMLPQSKRSFAGYAVRQGLAIAMEHNFMMSPAGRDNFRKQLMQLVGSIQLTNAHGREVHDAECESELPLVRRSVCLHAEERKHLGLPHRRRKEPPHKVGKQTTHFHALQRRLDKAVDNDAGKDKLHHS